MKSDDILKEFIGILIEQQSPTRLRRDLMNVTMRLTMTKDSHVPDTLTKIRVLPGVAVVGQKAPVNRSAANTILEIYVKFLPKTSNTYQSIKSVGKLIKSLPGIKIIKILTVGGRPVIFKGSPVII